MSVCVPGKGSAESEFHSKMFVCGSVMHDLLVWKEFWSAVVNGRVSWEIESLVR